MKKEPLQRCGRCGAWEQDPAGYSQDEQDKAELVECGCYYYEQHAYEPTRQEMYEAGIISKSEYENGH